MALMAFAWFSELRWFLLTGRSGAMLTDSDRPHRPQTPRIVQVKMMAGCTDVLQSTGSFSKQSEGVVDEAAVQLPERRVVCEGDVFTSSCQQVGGHLRSTQVNVRGGGEKVTEVKVEMMCHHARPPGELSPSLQQHLSGVLVVIYHHSV
ncbi:hypothetical protein INR49_006912, partial [Caranx melampygus]